MAFADRMLLKMLLISALVLSLMASLSGLWYHQQQQQVQQWQQQSALALESVKNQIQYRLQEAERNLLYLSQSSALESFLRDDNATAREQLQNRFLHFMRSYRFYDQVRLLDSHGQERLRLNQQADQQVVVVPEARLQNKADRYYFQLAVTLPPRRIYISPLDLNVENGAVEVPHKPVIRLAMPIYEQQQLLGVLVLNQQVDDLLDIVRQQNRQAQLQTWLLNDEAYWLVSDQEQQEWGFMLPLRQQQNLQQLKPALWQRIIAAEPDEAEDALLLVETIDPGKESWSYKRQFELDSQDRWYLVAYGAKTLLSKTLRGKRNRALLGFFTGSALLLGLILSISYLREKRLQSDRAGQVSRLQFKALADSAPDGVLIVDDAGEILFVNAQAEQLFQYPAAAMLGQSVDMLVPEARRHQHAAFRQNYAEHPLKRPMSESLDIVGQRADGSTIPVLISLGPLELEDQTMTICMVHDMSHEREADQQIQLLNRELNSRVEDLTEARKRLLLATSSAHIGIWEWDVVHDILHWNQEMYTMHNTRFAEHKHNLQAWKHLIFSEDQPKFERAIQAGLSAEEPMSVIVRIHSNPAEEADEIRHLQCYGTVIRNAKGVPERLLGVSFDISERQEIEEIRDLNRQLNAINNELKAFSYSVSHDLRAPLRSIDGFSLALQEDYESQLDEQAVDYLNRIRNAAQKMGQLIDDMLQLSRINQQPLQLQTVDLSALAQEVFEEAQQSYVKPVAFIVPEGLQLKTDKQMLRIILANLIGNACKFTQKTEQPRVELSIHHAEDESPVYVIRDNGAGFDMKYKNKLFTAFQRLHTKDDFPGTGVGLATVQRAINRLGGSIRVESQPGLGTSFYFQV